MREVLEPYISFYRIWQMVNIAKDEEILGHKPLDAYETAVLAWVKVHLKCDDEIATQSFAITRLKLAYYISQIDDADLLDISRNPHANIELWVMNVAPT